MNKVKVALIGAGPRASTIWNMPCSIPMNLRWLPSRNRISGREQFKARYGLEDSACFENWNDFFAGPKLADAVLICTQDKRISSRRFGRWRPVTMSAGKPMSPDPEECIRMGEMASQAGLVFSICHVFAIYAVFHNFKGTTGA